MDRCLAARLVKMHARSVAIRIVLGVEGVANQNILQLQEDTRGRDYRDARLAGRAFKQSLS